METDFKGARFTDWARTPKVFVDGPKESPHRYSDGSLCMWYPQDPPEQKWVFDDGLLALLGFQRARTIDERSARLEQRDRFSQQAQLHCRQCRDVGLLPEPGDVGVPANGAGGAAGCIEDDPVEGLALPGEKVGGDHARIEMQAHQVFT